MKLLFKRLIKKQRGFTAVELLIGVALIGIIGGAIATTVAQTFSGSSLSSIQMTAINNVRNAGDWITRDAQQAQAWKSSLVPEDTTSGDWINLTAPPDGIKFVWYEYDPNTYPSITTEITVTYTIAAGSTNLTRAESSRTKVGGVWSASSNSQSIQVARNIKQVRRAFIFMDAAGEYADTNFLKVEITSIVTTGNKSAEETRIFEIRMRPQR